MKKVTVLEQHMKNLQAAQTFEDYKAAQLKYVQFLIDAQAAEDRFKSAAFEYVVHVRDGFVAEEPQS